MPMIARWVRDAINAAGMSGAELARQMNLRGFSVDRAAVNKMMLERATPKTKPRKVTAAELIAISEITKCPLPLDIPAENEQIGDRIKIAREAAGLTQAERRLERPAIITSFDPDATNEQDGEFLPDNHSGVSTDRVYKADIPGASPVIDTRAGAGPGGIGLPALAPSGGVIYSEDAVIGEILLPGYLQQEISRAPAGRIHWVRVRGDSMEPTLQGGDHVAVDTTDTALGQGGMFVARNGDGEIIVKRLYRIPKSDPPQIEVRSDNAALEPPRVVDADWLTVIGRVVAKIGRIG